MSLFIILQTIQNNEDLGIKSLLIAAIVALGGVCVYLYKSKETALTKKDERIREVIKDHQDDLKENTQDVKMLVEKYHQFTQNLKDVLNGKI